MDDGEPLSPMSDASTKVELEVEPAPRINTSSSTTARGIRQRAFDRARHAATSQNVFLFLLGLRILNALSVKTFFQPDEYFQSLEPAWQMAFGPDSGAWITWEWKYQLRSAIHPWIFAALYWSSARLSELLQLGARDHAELLIAAPKVLQAAVAAAGDYYTWKLAEKIYGQDSHQAWTALGLTVLSPWQWFCSTRTLSNCLETTLTVLALCGWPWHFTLPASAADVLDIDRLSLAPQHTDEPGDSTTARYKLSRSLFCAAIACVLRPTNILIWICLACFVLFRRVQSNHLQPMAWVKVPVWLSVSWPALLSANQSEQTALIREAAISGSLVLGISAVADRIFYQQWTFPPLRFLYFNLAQSLAVFYGQNPWHYYLSQGFPFLLTTYLPFAIVGIYSALSSPHLSTSLARLPKAVLFQLASTVLFVPAILSLVSHKEVRFIYPLLPLLHVLAAPSFHTYFRPALTRTRQLTVNAHLKTITLLGLLTLNLLIAAFATAGHQPGPLSVMAYLRHQHEDHYLTQPPTAAHLPPAPTTMTVGFLMPCHSTPWRSHLVHPGIRAWALGCEPPVDLPPNSAARAAYLDEADVFYAAPAAFLLQHLGQPARRTNRLLGTRSPLLGLGLNPLRPEEVAAFDGRPGRKFWPEYLVFFEPLEPVLQRVAGNSGYAECWRGWNSFGHDDARRRGDIVVWCFRGRDTSTSPAIGSATKTPLQSSRSAFSWAW